MSGSPVDILLDQLDLARTGDSTFVGRTADFVPGAYERLFGGLIAAQSLRAAQATVRPEHHAHSLHGYFLTAGRAGQPVELEVDPLRDGRSFSTRRVVARQDNEPIFTLIASFHRDELGAEFQVDAPGVPDPEAPGVQWAVQDYPTYPPAEMFEFRRAVLPPVKTQDTAHPVADRYWARAVAPLPDDRALHTCALAYLSDLSTLTAMALAIELPWDQPWQGASLDHTVHFHRPLRLDDWVLVEMCPVFNGGNRGLVRNTVHSRAGVLGASVSQEGLLRA